MGLDMRSDSYWLVKVGVPAGQSDLALSRTRS